MDQGLLDRFEVRRIEEPLPRPCKSNRAHNFGKKLQVDWIVVHGGSDDEKEELHRLSVRGVEVDPAGRTRDQNRSLADYHRAGMRYGHPATDRGAPQRFTLTQKVQDHLGVPGDAGRHQRMDHLLKNGGLTPRLKSGNVQGGAEQSFDRGRRSGGRSSGGHAASKPSLRAFTASLPPRIPYRKNFAVGKALVPHARSGRRRVAMMSEVKVRG